MICNCIDWKFNIDKVNAPFMLAAARNPGRINYDGKQFRYCPWCSKPLRDEGSGTKSVAAPSESLIPKKEVVPHDCLQEKERRIYTKCPACLNDTLTINDDKHLLCTWVYCPNPTLIDSAGVVHPDTEKMQSALKNVIDCFSAAEIDGAFNNNLTSEQRMEVINRRLLYDVVPICEAALGAAMSGTDKKE